MTSSRLESIAGTHIDPYAYLPPDKLKYQVHYRTVFAAGEEFGIYRILHLQKVPEIGPTHSKTAQV